MNTVREGDKKQALCEKCQSITLSTYHRRTVPINDGTGIVNNLLVGVCDICNSVVTIPHQSVPEIEHQINAQKQDSSK
jgi:hypothetical protein